MPTYSRRVKQKRFDKVRFFGKGVTRLRPLTFLLSPSTWYVCLKFAWTKGENGGGFYIPNIDRVASIVYRSIARPTKTSKINSRNTKRVYLSLCHWFSGYELFRVHVVQIPFERFTFEPFSQFNTRRDIAVIALCVREREYMKQKNAFHQKNRTR